MQASEDGQKLGKAEAAKILKEARKRFERAAQWEAKTRTNEDNDEKFAEGDSYNRNQWSTSDVQARGNRPCLTDNVVRQHNLLIINDARMNKASIKVSPVGADASYEAAMVFEGMIRAIEARSKALDAYSTATFQQVQRGIGYVRIGTDYLDEDSFDQDVCVHRVPDPKSIYLDPDAKEYDKADMNWAFVFVDKPRDIFEAEHGEGAAALTALEWDEGASWVNEHHVREAEYWRRGVDNDTLLGLSDGRTVKESVVSREDLEKAGLTVVQEREVSRPTVEWFLLRGNEVVERREWPGRYIPIVPFIGEETVIDGVLDRKGHTRAQMDSQRMFNHWNSAAAEWISLQTKSPWLAPVRAIEGYETYWNTANTRPHSVLPYNDIDDDGKEIREPTRTEPPQMAQAFVEGMNIARERIREVTGQYQAEQGAPSNERSGVAIQMRQRQGDLATYHYIDNQAKAIRQCGRIILDLIPHVYDAKRVVKIMGEDGVTQSDVHVDPSADAAHQHVAMTPQGPQPVSADVAAQAENDEGSPLDVRVIFNPNVGIYDVQADVGPNFGTQRQEAYNAFAQIVQAQPDLIHIAGDLMFDAADFPGAQALAKRLKRGVPAQFLGGPSPELQQAQQTAVQIKQEAEHRIVMLQQQINDLTTELKSKENKDRTEDYRAETQRLAAVGGIDPSSLQIIVRQMVEQMLGTPIAPMLQRHADLEQSLQPPEPEQGTAQ